MSDSLTGYFYQHWIMDTVGTPVGNNGLVQAPCCASQTILSHMDRAISATGKTKVGGKLHLCSFAKFVLPAEYEKHMPRPAKVYPRETRQTLSLEAYLNWCKNGVHGTLTDWKAAYFHPTTTCEHWGETITDCATNCTLQHASKRDIVLIYGCMERASCLFLLLQ